MGAGRAQELPYAAEGANVPEGQRWRVQEETEN